MIDKSRMLKDLADQLEAAKDDQEIAGTLIGFGAAIANQAKIPEEEYRKHCELAFGAAKIIESLL